MADGQRANVVDMLFMHHTAGPVLFTDKDPLYIQDTFDSWGWGRAYQPAGVTRSYHKHPSRAKDTFAQAHFCLHKYTKDGNKYGWKLTPLMDDVWNNVAWHCGVWNLNQRSIGIETDGTWTNTKLPEKALMLVADTFRSHDVKIGGILDVRGHREVYSTICPGLINDQTAIIEDMINNPKKWNDKLFPAATPAPTPSVPQSLINFINTYRHDVKRAYNSDPQGYLSWFTKSGVSEVPQMYIDLAKIRDAIKVEITKVGDLLKQKETEVSTLATALQNAGEELSKLETQAATLSTALAGANEQLSKESAKIERLETENKELTEKLNNVREDFITSLINKLRNIFN